MTNWDRNFSNGSNPGHWIGRLIYNLDSQNVGANTSHISLYLQTFSDNGAYTQNGLWDGRIYINGGQVARATPTQNVGTGAFQITSYGADVGHDANGNCSFNIGDYINAPVNEMTFSQIGWTLPRLALAPTISSLIVDTIKPTSVNFGVELSSYGHGTVAAMYVNYRVAGSGSAFTSTAAQNDAAGYNYFPVTGLKPGTNYEYYGITYNNNGDQSQTGSQFVKTQSIAGIIPVLMGVM